MKVIIPVIKVLLERDHIFKSANLTEVLGTAVLAAREIGQMFLLVWWAFLHVIESLLVIKV